MPAEKLSISLPADLSRFIEQYRTDHALKNRSQVIGEALKLLRQRDLEAAYREMAQDEAAEVEALEWSEALVGDGANEAR